MANQEPLKKIGLIIKAAREQRGWSQDELAYESRVSITHLKNIEEANRKELPEEAYLLGFISKILRALNFNNPNDIIEKYKGEEGSYIVQSIVNSHEVNNSKLGFAFVDFKIYHLYTIFIVCLIALAWLTIANYGKNNINLDQLQPNIKTNTQANDQKEPAANGAVNGLELEANTSILDNEPNVTKQVVSSGVGSKLLTVEAMNNAWYQVIGVAQQKILYEGDVGPSSNVDHFKFYDDQGFVLATGDAGAFMVDTGNGPFKLGKPNETIKWYYPQAARRIYKAWSETTQVTKIDSATPATQAPNLISDTDVVDVKPFVETTEEKKPEAITSPAATDSPTTYNLQEQQLIESPIVKKTMSPEQANDELMNPFIKKTSTVTPQPYRQSKPIVTYQTGKPGVSGIKPVIKEEVKKKKNKKKKEKEKKEKEERERAKKEANKQ